VARPSSYKTEYAEQAEKLCKLGAIDTEVADFFNVNIATIYRWKNQHPEFCESLKVGKEPANDRVEHALYHRAVGYSHPEDDIRVVNGEIVITPTVKHYPPDTKAALAWLYNRVPDKWHPKPEGMTPEDVSRVIEIVRATRQEKAE